MTLDPRPLRLDTSFGMRDLSVILSSNGAARMWKCCLTYPDAAP